MTLLVDTVSKFQDQISENATRVVKPDILASSNDPRHVILFALLCCACVLKRRTGDILGDNSKGVRGFDS